MDKSSASGLQTMTDRSAEKILERRRVQNREAQRRFREKKIMQKTINWLQGQNHQQKFLPLHDICISPPNEVTTVTDLRGGVDIWDMTISDPTGVQDNGFPGQQTALSDMNFDVPIFPLQDTGTTVCASIEDNPNIPNHNLAAGTFADNFPSLNGTTLGLRSPGLACTDQQCPSSASKSPASSTSSGWLSPLHVAAKKGSDSIIRMLLEHDTCCDQLDSDGLTPLIHAVLEGHEEATRLLLDRGARIESIQKDDGQPGRSAIHWAVLKKHAGVLRVLLDHAEKQVIDSYDDTGRVPLHIAIDIDFEVGVSLLLRSGADASKRVHR